jgi:hypothetical protein
MVPRTGAEARPAAPSWAELVRAEPKLAALRARARVLGRKVRRGNYWPVWERVKAEMATLVGWHRRDRHPLLGTSSAWDAAYAVLIKAFEEE